jgi:hypothetical protein
MIGNLIRQNKRSTKKIITRIGLFINFKAYCAIFHNDVDCLIKEFKEISHFKII